MSDDLQHLGNLSPEKRTLLALRRMQSKIDELERAKIEPIAIIGMSCRFPGGANDPEAFWKLLHDGVDAITEIPTERWDLNAFYDPNPEAPDKMTTRWGGFIDHVDRFDAAFFGISPREAMFMDPQQRLLLEVAWDALEHACQPIDSLAGSQTGVFVGVSNNDYFHLQLDSSPITHALLETGNRNSFISGRLCYVLDFRGPSVSIDTVCSSSLVAVHLACQSLRTGESRLALAGGVNLILSPMVSIMVSKWGIVATDGRCKTFDARANGMVRSEGCGIVVLKRLSDALADGDPILALIRGSAANQDGRSAALTAPNGQSQQAVIRQALNNSGVDPAAISYVEAHGSGTALGDPIEVEALTRVIGQPGPDAQPCALGAVKTNLGHLEAAAGVAGLIKTVLALRHETIPANLHFQNLNPHITLDHTRFVIPTALQSWPSGERRRYAGVSSFGLSGTNAHVVLEEPPADLAAAQASTTTDVDEIYLLPLSARSPDALQELARAYQALLRAPNAPPLRDLAYTAGTRRAHHHHRLTLMGGTLQALDEQLTAFLAGEAHPGLASGHTAPGAHPRLVFVFPGQVFSQWLGRGQQLYAQEPIFRQTFDACADACQPYLDDTLQAYLHAVNLPTRIDIIQPLQFALAVSLSALWCAWGVEPAAMIGHSMGEIAASYVAGALSLADAARIICQRSRLLRQVSGQGAMALVELSLNAAQAVLAGYENRVWIAVSNSLRSTVLAGEPAALEAILADLERQQVYCRRLNVDVASHNPMMEPLAPELRRLLAELRPQVAQLPIYSTVTSEVLEGTELTAEYWIRNLCEPVQFSTAVQQVLAAGHTHFLEVSPHPVLLPAIESDLRELGQAGVVLGSLRRGEDERAMLLGSLGQLYVSGYPVEWRRLYREKCRCVELPRYPWQRERYWLEAVGSGRRRRDHPLLGTRAESAMQPGTCYWEQTLSLAEMPYLADHQVHGLVVLPGAVYVEWALAGARAVLAAEAALAQVEFRQMLTLGAQEVRIVQVAITADDSGTRRFQVFSRPVDGVELDSAWVLHAVGTISLDLPDVPEPVAYQTIQERCAEGIAAKMYYEHLAAQGLEYGPSFRGIAEVWRRDGEALARLEPTPTVLTQGAAYHVHPALLDACFQVLTATAPLGRAETYLPVGLDGLRYYDRPKGIVWSYARLESGGDADAVSRRGDLFLLDEMGQVLVEVRGMRLQRLETVQRDVIADWLYELDWQPQECVSAAETVLPPNCEQWLIFADAAGVGAALVDKLTSRGATCVTVMPGAGVLAGQAGQYQVDPTQAEAFRQLFQEAYGSGRSACRNVVFLWGVEPPEGTEPTLESLIGAQRLGWDSLLYLVQALTQTGWRDAPRLWVVTRGAQTVGSSDQRLMLEQASLWGLGRTVMYEHPGLRCTLIDLDVAGTATEAESLTKELWSQTAEDQVALRADGRYVARLVHLDSETRAAALQDVPRTLVSAGEQPFRLEITRPGMLDQLALRATSRRPPDPGEVEIEVVAAGLNFLDVLSALGAIPDDTPGAGQTGPRLGQECAGRIVALGEGVDNFVLGQEVVALAQGSFATHVTASQLLMVPKPANLTFEQAAAIPVVFLTAYYALYHVGRLMKGERVLIHAAAGGVGLAAVQLAQRVGAEIFATAGSPEKRAFLHALGVSHVLDSRSLTFAEDVRRLTGGEGVDVVLNSLSGEFISHSFALLRDHGRFIELGKRDYYDDRKLGLRPFLKNLTFSLVDLRAMMYQRPVLIQSLFQEVTQLFASGALTPIRYEVYPIAQVESAFHTMAQARHIGKLVVSFAERSQALLAPASRRSLTICAEGTYVISGGLGGIGLQVARWLVEQGARNLLLLGRHGPSPAAQELLAELDAAGARVQVAQVDVAQREALAEVLEQAACTLPPLRGVFHAAAVLDDGTILQLTPAHLARVMAPKLAGAWNLHTLTRQQPLDYFVLFSSVASLLGSPGQANYAAANAFLDTLTHYRRACGLPALGINWGAWAEVGLAAAQANRGERLAYQGMGSMTPAQGLEAFGRLLCQDRAQVSVMLLNLRQWRQYYPKVAAAPLFSHLMQEQDHRDTARPGKNPVRDTLLTTEPDQRWAILETHLRDQIAQVLRLDPRRIDIQTPLGSIGFDSLLALELRNRLETTLGLSLPGTLIWGRPTMKALIPYLAEKMEITLESAKDMRLESLKEQESSSQEDQEAIRLLMEMGVLEDLERLSDDEVRQMLSN